MKLNGNLSLFKAMAICACMLCLSSCIEDEIRPTDQEARGKLDLNLFYADLQIDSSEMLKSADLSAFQVIIRTIDGHIIMQYENIGEMPEETLLPEGLYIAEANSGNFSAASFENPYYQGISEAFEILEGTTTSVAIQCKLANAMVSIHYSERLKQTFHGYQATVHSANDSLIFGPLETRTGYFEITPLNIIVDLTYVDAQGQTENKSLQGLIDQPLQGVHYKINVDASMHNGATNFNISLDSTTTELEIHIQDEPVGDIPKPGELIISEIMNNPAILSDSEGEWIEIYNTSNRELNLEGLYFKRNASNDSVQIDTNIYIPAQGRAVLARTASACENISFVYGSGISLPNSGSNLLSLWLHSETSSTCIAELDYGGSNFPSSQAGASLQLCLAAHSSAAYQDGANWGLSTLAFQNGDLGSPGNQNESCQ